MLVWKLSMVCANLPVLDSIHNLGLVGHIEDIVVNKDQQGKKLGLRIIEALVFIAERVGCYKVSPSVLFSPSRAMACAPSLSRRCEPLKALHTTNSWTFVGWTQFLTLSCPLSMLLSDIPLPHDFPHHSHPSPHALVSLNPDNSNGFSIVPS